jgi:hypothetical protein
MGMKDTYGDKPRFVAFDVKIGDTWLNVPKAEEFVKKFDLEFVHYKRINATLVEIDAERDADSVQAVRNGMGERHKREGIVLRPIEEMIINNGERVIAKHKRDDFKETKTSRKIIDPAKLEVLADARKIADEWVTEDRMNHILSKGLVELDIKSMGKVISLMLADVTREAAGEIVESHEAKIEISRATALMFKRRLEEEIKCQ